ncbi:MAG: ihfB [Rickettsiales bacterium]|nr:ihfB [Rickettsiales bacterium]
MTKSELIKLLAKKHTTLYQKDIERLVDVVFGEISTALKRGDRIELRGFGAFSTRSRKPRKARNPKTGDVVPLGERVAPYFRAGKELRERLNKA